MIELSTSFAQVKQECIDECGKHSLEEIAKGMFEKKEIIDLFSELAQRDEAYEALINILSAHEVFEDGGSIYMPGSGTGGLARRIMKTHPQTSVLQVDSSQAMTIANRKASKEYDGTEIICEDVRTVDLSTQSFDAVIAYGLMRYIPAEQRNDLVNSWEPTLKPKGIVIVGEGIAEDIVKGIMSERYVSQEFFEHDAQLFRCSLFYLLFNRFEQDKKFRNEVQRTSTKDNTRYVDVLKDIAGFVPRKVYTTVLNK